jgi:hypothetical protein
VKSFGFSLGLSVLAGALVALGVAVFPLEAGLRSSAFLGVGVGAVIGVLSLIIKTQLVALLPGSRGGLQAVLTGQVLTFLLRLLAVGAGALALHGDEQSSPVAFVLTFFLVYLAQQFVEVRSLLAMRAVKPEVT